MITPTNSKQGQLRTLVIIMGICLIPVMCGILVLIHQVDRKLDRQAQAAASRALHVTSEVFDSLRSIHINIQQPPYSSCGSLAPKVRSAVNADPLLHSLSANLDGWLPCHASPDTPADHAELGQLAAQGVTLTTQGTTGVQDAVLIFARQYQGDILLATIRGEALHDRLSVFNNGPVLELDFGDHSIWVTRDGYDHERPALTLNRVTKTSVQHGYSVRAGFTASVFRSSLVEHALQTLPLFTLIGLLTGGAAYLAMYRGDGRRAGTAVTAPATGSTRRSAPRDAPGRVRSTRTMP